MMFDHPYITSEGTADAEPDVEKLAKSYADILSEVGEDLSRDGILKTPHRAGKAFIDLTAGYRQNLNDMVNDALFDTINNDMVVVKDIEYYSLCEHHLLPFYGKCHVGYLPENKVIGLSKIPRIVDMFARRLQVQENLTRQIADAITEATNARGVAVVMEGEHMCMMMRGVQKQHSSTTTSVMLGDFKAVATRSEFIHLAGL